MDWQEKITRLLKGKNASELARGVGLRSTAITDAAKKRQMPRADKAVKIAHALGVSADELFDDARELSPQRAGDPRTAFSGVPDFELFAELFARHKRLIIAYNEAIEALKGLKKEGSLDELSASEKSVLLGNVNAIIDFAQSCDSLAMVLLTAGGQASQLKHATIEIFGSKAISHSRKPALLLDASHPLVATLLATERRSPPPSRPKTTRARKRLSRQTRNTRTDNPDNRSAHKEP